MYRSRFLTEDEKKKEENCTTGEKENYILGEEFTKDKNGSSTIEKEKYVIKKKTNYPSFVITKSNNELK